MMEKVMLSGGDFGGMVVEADSSQDVIEMKGEDGSVWIYRRGEKRARGKADLSEVRPADPG